jgi:uncharacterized membrane protein YjjP (DUF1212 family)
MAQSSPAESTPENQSGASSPRTGLVGGLKSALRQQQRVNFFLAGDGHDSANPDLESGRTPIPTLQIPESEDVGNVSLKDNEYNERTSAAAEKARSAADQLYSDLSRRNSLEDLSNSTTADIPKPVYEPVEPKPASIWSRLRPSKRRRSDLEGQPRPHRSPPLLPLDKQRVFDDMPLVSTEKPSRPYDINDDTDDETAFDGFKPLERQSNSQYMHEAKRVVRRLTRGRQRAKPASEPRSGARTPALDKHLHDLDYIPEPAQYKPGILGAILTSRLQDIQNKGDQARDFYKSHQRDGWLTPGAVTPRQSKRPEVGRSRSYDGNSNGSSGTTTPKRKWYDKSPTTRGNAMGALLAQASLSSTAPGVPTTPGAARPSLPRSKSADLISSAVEIIKSSGSSMRSKSYNDQESEMIAQVADIIARREYLKKLCRCFMRYGAPTHRMEEYLTVSARALSVDATFLYMPNVMIITFSDEETYSTNVQVIRESSGLDFGRLKDTFEVYKCIIHDKYTAEEAGEQLDAIASRRDQYRRYTRILIYGIAAVCVGPFAFGARPIDFIPIFFMGAALGFLQLVVIPMSDQFSHVFEVFTAFCTAFAARGLGSINRNGSGIFCFSAMAQSSIALILPGYIVLNAALELQSRNLVSGSVRMVYAIIYSKSNLLT